MQPQSLEFLIRQLANGTLPMKSIPRIWGGPGNGEKCEACNGGLTQDEWVIEGISLAGSRHVKCFHHWQQERHAMPPPPSRQTRPGIEPRSLTPALPAADQTEPGAIGPLPRPVPCSGGGVKAGPTPSAGD